MERTATTVLWLLTAIAAFYAWSRHRAPGAVPSAIAAFFLSSLHWWNWNKPIYLTGRNWLADSGIYDQRLFLKVGIGLLAVLVVAFSLRPAARQLARWGWACRIAATAALLDALYITLRTLSIDGWMPDAIAVGSGKSTLAITLAAIALLGALAAIRRAAPKHRHGQDPSTGFVH